MKEIPLPLIKANQAGIVLFVLLSFVLQQPGFIYLLFLIQLIPLVLGAHTNVFIPLAKLALSKERLRSAETQAMELARFNQTIAVVCLGLATVSHLIGWSVLAYIFAGMVTLAAFVAILGYCIGCTLYYQYKRLKFMRS